jgi:hypothetical protein
MRLELFVLVLLARYSVCVPVSLLAAHTVPRRPDCMLVVVPVFELDNTKVPFLVLPFLVAQHVTAPFVHCTFTMLFTNMYSIPALAGSHCMHAITC